MDRTTAHEYRELARRFDRDGLAAFEAKCLARGITPTWSITRHLLRVPAADLDAFLAGLAQDEGEPVTVARVRNALRARAGGTRWSQHRDHGRPPRVPGAPAERLAALGEAARRFLRYREHALVRRDLTEAVRALPEGRIDPKLPDLLEESRALMQRLAQAAQEEDARLRKLAALVRRRLQQPGAATPARRRNRPARG